MRIAVIATGGFHPSGTEQVVPSWIALFGRLSAQHDVHVFVLRHLQEKQTYRLKGVTVHDLGRPWAPFGFGLWAQARALAAEMTAAGSFDVVHGLWGDPAGVLATRMAKRFSRPSITTCDSGEFVGFDDIGYGSQRTRRGRHRVLEAVGNATVVHVCTTSMADHVRRLGVAPIVIPFGVDTSVTTSPLSKGPPWHVLQIGSLSPVKNQSVLIEAISIVAQTHDVHLDLVGQDTLRGAFQTQARALGIQDRVTFHGFVPHESLAAVRAKAHLYVQTSRHESAGVAVLESAAAGIPILGTRVGYVSDWAGSRARAIDTLTRESLASEIMALLDDQPACQKLMIEARSFARQFDTDYTVAEFDRVYRDVSSRT
jgi:glycosyltransferase involved in cell wall biosynthesis